MKTWNYVPVSDMLSNVYVMYIALLRQCDACGKTIPPGHNICPHCLLEIETIKEKEVI